MNLLLTMGAVASLFAAVCWFRSALMIRAKIPAMSSNTGDPPPYFNDYWMPAHVLALVRLLVELWCRCAGRGR
jgi:hypothetical protein